VVLFYLFSDPNSLLFYPQNSFASPSKDIFSKERECFHRFASSTRGVDVGCTGESAFDVCDQSLFGIEGENAVVKIGKFYQSSFFA
jgi:hypothetical protein